MTLNALRLHIKCDDGSTAVVFVLAVDARAVPEVAVGLPVTTPLVARYQIGCKVKMRQLPILVQVNGRPLNGHEHVRGAIVVFHCVPVWLDGLRQECPRLAVRAEEVRAEQGGGAVLPLVRVESVIDLREAGVNDKIRPRM